MFYGGHWATPIMLPVVVLCFFTILREVENKNSGCSRATFTNLSFDILF